MKNKTTLYVLQLDDRNFKVTGFRVQTGLQAGKPLGDSVASLTHFTGLDRLSNLYTQLTGLDVGVDVHSPQATGRSQWPPGPPAALVAYLEVSQ